MSADTSAVETIEEVARAIVGRYSLDTKSDWESQAWADFTNAELIANGGLGVGDPDWFEYACAVLRGAFCEETNLPLVEASLVRLIFDREAPSAAAVAFVDPDIPQSLTCEDRDDGRKITGWATGVPWSAVTDFIVARGPEPDTWILVRVADCEIDRRTDRWGRPVGDVRMSETTVQAVGRMTEERVMSYGRVAVACAMSGTMSTILAMSIKYAKEREQFGRPLWSFQTIKHQLVVASELVKVAERTSIASADIARTSDERMVSLLAKCTAGSAATTVGNIAHHVHGAIGMTDEYKLSHLTRQLFMLRDRFGSEHECLRAFAKGLVSVTSSGTSLWELITAL